MSKGTNTHTHPHKRSFHTENTENTLHTCYAVCILFLFFHFSNVSVALHFNGLLHISCVSVFSVFFPVLLFDKFFLNFFFYKMATFFFVCRNYYFYIMIVIIVNFYFNANIYREKSCLRSTRAVWDCFSYWFLEFKC